MQVFKSELTISFDLDDTLLMWRGNVFQPGVDEISGREKLKVIDPNDGEARFLVPHERHIRFLKKCANRGYQVTVWSSGGWAWAESAVKTLGLEEYVAKVESKPLKVVDDLPKEHILHNRVYLEDIEGASE